MTAIIWLILGQVVLPNADPEPELTAEFQSMDEDTSIVDKNAQIFVQSFMDDKLEEMLGLMSDPFTYDGRVIHGRKTIKSVWKKTLADRKKRFRKDDAADLKVMEYKEVIEKYGKAPKKFSHLKLKRCKFVTAHFAWHTGFMMIFSKDKEKGWLLTAVTD